MPSVAKDADARPSPWAHRGPIAVALTLAACVAWPTIAEMQRQRLAEVLADRLLNWPGAASAAGIGELAGLGDCATAPLVRLAAAQRLDLARAAQGAVLDRMEGWQIAFENRGDAAALGRRMAELAAALQRYAPQFGDEGRRWARRVARQAVQLSGPLSGEQSWEVLARCELVLQLPLATPQRAAADEVAQGEPRKVPQPAPKSHVPPVQTPGSRAAEAALTAKQAPAELAVVLNPLADGPEPSAAGPRQAVGPVNVLRSHAEEAAHGATPPGGGGDAAAGRAAAESAAAKRAEGTAVGKSAVDVPSPLEQRRRLRELRGLSDRQLTALLDHPSPFQAAAARKILEQRGYSAGVLQAVEQVDELPTNERLAAVERAATLPAADARRLLRHLVSDKDPEVRLLALTTLATSGDPQLEEIARRRAVEDDDARVAELAARLIERVK